MLKSCFVNPVFRSVDPQHPSLYEAIAQALAVLSAHDWVGDIGKGLTTVTVTVRHPEVTHTVKMQDFDNWLNRGCRSPAQTVLKTLGIAPR